MTAILIFIVLPVSLLLASLFIKPLVQRDRRHGDPFGEGMTAAGLFGGHGLTPDERVVPEEEGVVRFEFGDLAPALPEASGGDGTAQEVKQSDVKRRE